MKVKQLKADYCVFNIMLVIGILKILKRDVNFVVATKISNI